jgi:iron complex transport system ATP-binding protein
MLTAKRLSVNIGSRPILDNVSFTARSGAFSAIIGPNGCGKTTLMRALSGDLGFSGSATLHDQDVSAAKAWELAMMRAVLPQASSLSFPFTVREIVNLGITTGLAGSSCATKLANLCEQALCQVDLEGFGSRFYQELSGGEQQRVQMARVLCQVWEPLLDGKSRYLFLDEPISSLDIRHQIQIMQIARDYVARGGSVLAILHDLNLTAMFADTVILLNGGQVFAQGRPSDVLTSENLSQVYQYPLAVNTTPPQSSIFVLPHAASRPRPASDLQAR